jgi:hypothetical protein
MFMGNIQKKTESFHQYARSLRLRNLGANTIDVFAILLSLSLVVVGNLEKSMSST